MSDEKIAVVLASQSPRRKELLNYITDEFSVIPSDYEEVLPEGLKTEDVPIFLAAQKALDVSKSHPDELVIGCDTVVILGETILGKPKDKLEAFNMLSLLSGRTHKVISGVCLCLKGKTMSFSEETEVKFYDLSELEILSYIETNSPMDKAGSYGIQDGGALFVESINGDYYNVMGLPVAKLKRKIDSFLKLF